MIESDRPLSDKQLEVLRLMAVGHTNEDIGQLLGNTEATIKNHVQKVISRLGAYNRCSAIWQALKIGVLKVPTVATPAPMTEKQERIERIPFDPGAPIMKWRGVEICPDRRVMRVDGVTAIKPGRKVLLVIRFFLQHPNRVYARSAIIDAVWGTGIFIEDRAVDVYIRRARKALGPYAVSLTTEWGVGYQFKMEKEEEFA